MSNRLLINIANAIEWLKSREEQKEFYQDVLNFLEEAANILQPAVEDLRGKDINHSEQVRKVINKHTTPIDVCDRLLSHVCDGLMYHP